MWHEQTAGAASDGAPSSPAATTTTMAGDGQRRTLRHVVVPALRTGAPIQRGVSASSSPLSGDGVFFALDTPMTPDGSPPADAPTRLPQTLRLSTSSVNTSRSPPKSLGALAFLRLNAVQRVLSAAVLVPLVTVFLWRSPAFATATFCAFVTSLCSYEYAWLAHRIHTRVLDKVSAFELDPLSPTTATRSSTAQAATAAAARGPCERCSADGFDRHDSQHRSGRSTRSESGVADAALCRCSASRRLSSQVEHELSPTSSSTSSALQPPPPLPVQRLPSPDVCARPSAAVASTSVLDGDLLLLDVGASECAVSDVARRYFCCNEWLAALVLACVSTALMSSAFLLFAPWIPELETTELYRLRVFYAVTTDYVASLSALFTPNWRFAFICVVEKTVFTLLTLHSTICPINQFGCGLSMEPAQVFLSGVVLMLLFRLHTRDVSDTGSSSSSDSSSSNVRGMSLFLHILLDMLGFLYIVGSLSVIVAFVDDEQLEAYRKLLIVLLYVVWASDTGAYVTGKVLERLRYQSSYPLAAHLSKNKDYEGTLGAIVFGVAAMHFASNLLDVNGSTLAKLLFTVLAVIAGRVGDLFESLLKRAAGVKDSGKLIPGHGGMLDRIDALMFASLVFARYYAMIVVPNMVVDDPE